MLTAACSASDPSLAPSRAGSTVAPGRKQDAPCVSFPALTQATFVRRPNRFVVEVVADGRSQRAHLANSGRLQELLVPGNTLWLARRDREGRKTTWDVVLAACNSVLASADARVPNQLIARALRSGSLAEFAGLEGTRREIRHRDSRLDFLLRGSSGECLLEVKSVTLVEEGYGLFPDAPTTRGVRHVQELAAAARGGHRAAVLFVVQRSDARAFRPNDAADPAFGQALREAWASGVEVYTYACRVRLTGICLERRLPVEL